jgi:hypothetical protein
MRSSGKKIKPANPAAATPEFILPDTPAGKLAERFYGLQGNQSRWKNSRPAWVSQFQGLLSQHSEEDLIACLTWAFEIDDFWPKQLIRGDKDPLAYFTSKLDKIMPRSIGYYKAASNSKQTAKAEQNRPPVPPAGPSKSKFAWMRGQQI